MEAHADCRAPYLFVGVCGWVVVLCVHQEEWLEREGAAASAHDPADQETDGFYFESVNAQ